MFAIYPRYANLGVLGTNGELVASALPLSSPGDRSHHYYFRRTVETRSFSIGKFPMGPTNSEPVLGFGYPVLDSAGQVLAVVFAELDLTWFDRFASELPGQLPRAATWTEMDRQGNVLACSPQPEGRIGRPWTEAALLPTVFSASSGVLGATDRGGVAWFYAFNSRHSRLTDSEAVAVLGIPRQTLFAQADRALRQSLAWLGLAAGVALALGWLGSQLLIVRPVRALVRSTARLAAGDLHARTGLPGRDELGQLALAFDRMAQALERREQEHLRASQKLQLLSHRLVEVQESERRHIARELHDEIGQSLTAAEMNLQAALQAPRAPSLERRLEESIQAVERVLEQVHDLSLSLRPSMLDDLGLEPALRWYTQRQATLAGLQAEFRAEPLEQRLDPVIETECFRVGQEAMTNVVRHARATALSVELRRADGRLHLTVRDDGVGFDVAALRDEAVRGASLGLLSMEERAVLAGGGLEFNSLAGQGTEVHAWFPLKWREAGGGESND